MANNSKEIIADLENQYIDIVVILEIKRSSKQRKYRKIHKIHRAKTGASTMNNKFNANSIKNYKYILERIITLTISLYGTETVLVEVKASPNDNTQQFNHLFYEKLLYDIDKVKPHSKIIVAGDVDAGVRLKKDEVGRYGEAMINISGE